MSCGVTHSAVGGDEAGDTNQTGVGEQSRDLCYAPNVLLSVFRAETQVLIQALSNVISIQ